MLLAFAADSAADFRFGRTSFDALTAERGCLRPAPATAAGPSPARTRARFVAEAEAFPVLPAAAALSDLGLGFGLFIGVFIGDLFGLGEVKSLDDPLSERLTLRRPCMAFMTRFGAMMLEMQVGGTGLEAPFDEMKFEPPAPPAEQ